MNIKEIIDSGIIEDYCLGVLDAGQARHVEEICHAYPDLHKFLLATQDALLGVVTEYTAEAPPLSPEIIHGIRAHERLKEMDPVKPGQSMQEFIAIHRHSDHLPWRHLTSQLTPPAKFDIHVQELARGAQGMLMVVWIDRWLPSEVHTDVQESALLLEGSCTGNLGDAYFEINPGDFIEIPLNKPHDLKVTSDIPAKLIVMRKAVAS